MSGRYFGLTVEPGPTAREVGRYLLYLAYQFPSISLPLGFVGIWVLLRDFDVAGLLLMTVAVNASIFIHRTDWESATKFVFYIADYVVFGILCAVGTDEMLRRLASRAGPNRSRLWGAAILAAVVVLPVAIYEVVPTLAERFGLDLVHSNPLPYRDNQRYFLNPNKHGEDGASRYATEALETGATQARSRDFCGLHAGCGLAIPEGCERPPARRNPSIRPLRWGARPRAVGVRRQASAAAVPRRRSDPTITTSGASRASLISFLRDRSLRCAPVMFGKPSHPRVLLLRPGWRSPSAICLYLSALLLTAVACKSPDPAALKAESIRRGDELTAKKQYAQAAEEYLAGVETDPLDGHLRMRLAKAYVSAEDWALAGPAAVRAADLLPDDRDAQLQAAELLLGSGWFPDAAERASKVLLKEPGNVDAIMLVGNAKAQLRSSALALSKLEEAIRVGADYEGVRLGLRPSVSSSDDTAAELAFRKAVQVAPANLSTHIALANFLGPPSVLTKARSR